MKSGQRGNSTGGSCNRQPQRSMPLLRLPRRADMHQAAASGALGPFRNAQHLHVKCRKMTLLHFSPYQALFGGAILGAATLARLFAFGTVTGISGMVTRPFLTLYRISLLTFFPV
jgi:hypothetical protein